MLKPNGVIFPQNEKKNLLFSLKETRSDKTALSIFILYGIRYP